MCAFRSLLVLGLLVVALPARPAATAAPGNGQGPAPAGQPGGVWPDRLSVRFVADAAPGELERLQARLGVRGQVQRSRSGLTRLDFKPGADLPAIVAELDRSGLVELVGYDFVVTAFETPNDPAFEDQWHLQAGPGGLNAPAAWDLAPAKGAGVVVAVIDTGVAYETHTGAISIFPQNFAVAPELSGVSIVAPYDFANDDGAPGCARERCGGCHGDDDGCGLLDGHEQ